jgi:hypothetical protein
LEDPSERTGIQADLLLVLTYLLHMYCRCRDVLFAEFSDDSSMFDGKVREGRC